jgi:Cu(I)/Ag(I) efflux system membrane fusion protein
MNDEPETPTHPSESLGKSVPIAPPLPVAEPPAPSSPEPPRRRPWFWQWFRRLNVALFVITAFLLGLWLGLPAGEEDEHAGHGDAAGNAEATTWTCSMHPQIKLPNPGKCPICGMQLIPLQTGANEKKSDRQVSLSPEAVKLAEVQTTRVGEGEVTDELRLLGRLEYDETQVRTITSWVGGRIDRLYVSNVGAGVGAGSVIAKVYSPEVYAAHQDLIQARKQLKRLSDALPVARNAADAALEAARQRLKLLGIRDEDLQKMEREDQPWEHVSIHAPFGGTVLEQMVHQGAYVTTGSPLFRVAALGRLWVQLDAYETDLARIRLKDKVTLAISSFAGELFEGKISFIDPVLDPRTRTAQVRVEVPNPKGRLRPGMFAEAVIQSPEGEQPEAPLVIPKTAVLHTGQRSVVFVKVPGKEQPTYEAREVQLGPRAGNLYPVASGLQAGEEIVTRGAFALDAELQIRGGQSMMTMADDLARARTIPFEISAKGLATLEPLIAAYLTLHQKISSDDLEGTRRAFKAVMAGGARARIVAPEDAAKRWKQLRAKLQRALEEGRGANGLDEARVSFETVSVAVIEILRRYGNPTKNPVRLAFCPMARDNKGAEWVQLAEKIENPYFGSKMYRCGEIRGTADAKGRLPPAEPEGAAAAPTRGHQH